MKIRSRVTKFSGNRKIIEIPAVVRDHFKLGEAVDIEQIKKGKNDL